MNYNPFERFFASHDVQVMPDRPEIKKEKQSQKEADVFARKLLAEYPDIKNKILEVLKKAQENGVALPIIHITSLFIKSKKGEIETGFVESIKKFGLRQMDSNVATFVERENKTIVAEPEYFIENPEEMVKSVRLFLERYLHHGTRTNKQVLGEKQGKGRGVPMMMVFEGGTELKRGSDYDDHFIVGEDVEPEKLMAIIDLSDHYKINSTDDVAFVIEKILSSINFLIEKNNK